jgi:hypothetical protein
MRTQLKPHQIQSNLSSPHRSLVQRQCAGCGSRACPKCQKKGILQRFGVSTADTEVPPLVYQVLQQSGRSLDAKTQSFAEDRLGQDFSRVRVHTDANAATSAAAINALAYTHQQHVVFAHGHYQPHTLPGQRLLLHELVHVMQQSSALKPPKPPAESQPLTLSNPHDPYEQQATALAQQISQNEPLSTPDSTVQRLPPDTEKTPLETGTGTLPYADAMALTECIRIMGEENRSYCRQEVLGEAPPALAAKTSTPQLAEALILPDGSQQISIGVVTVLIKPDLFDVKGLKYPAETAPHLDLNPSTYTVKFDPDPVTKRIRSFKHPNPKVTVSIQTSYGVGVNPTAQSGYGYGTEPGAANTTLGSHEGRHGLDMIEYLKTHPFPVFRGRVGMTQAQFKKAVQNWDQAVIEFGLGISKYAEKGDCVGITIDQYMSQKKPVWQPICPPVKP